MTLKSILFLIFVATASVIICSALFVETSCTIAVVEAPFEERQLELAYKKFHHIETCTTVWDEFITTFEK